MCRRDRPANTLPALLASWCSRSFRLGFRISWLRPAFCLTFRPGASTVSFALLVMTEVPLRAAPSSAIPSAAMSVRTGRHVQPPGSNAGISVGNNRGFAVCHPIPSNAQEPCMHPSLPGQPVPGIGTGLTQGPVVHFESVTFILHPLRAVIHREITRHLEASFQRIRLSP